MKIEVTKEDIKNGIASDFSRCPVARALGRALNRDGVRVGGLFFWFSPFKNEEDFIPLPDSVKNFIQEFDSDFSVSPFSFELNIPVIPDTKEGGL